MFKKVLATTIVLLSLTGQSVWAHAHVHIGINMDQQDAADDNQLFLFGMPTDMQPENYWPNFPVWGDESDPYNMVAEPLKLVYQTSGHFAGSYRCEYLECFHSAHPDHGNWQLGGSNPETEPDWSIGIERVSASVQLQFIEEETLLPILQSAGDQFSFSSFWMSDKYNEDGTLGAWGIHEHVLFVVDGEGVNIGDTFSATIKAFDSGSTGYSDSQAYTLQFVAVPEPATLFLLTMGAAALIRQRRA